MRLSDFLYVSVAAGHGAPLCKHIEDATYLVWEIKCGSHEPHMASSICLQSGAPWPAATETYKKSVILAMQRLTQYEYNATLRI